MKRALLCAGALLIAQPAQAAGITPKPNRLITGGTNNGAYKVLDWRKGDCSGCVVDGVTWNVDRTGIDARGWDNFTLKNSTITLRSPTSGGDNPSGISITATTKPGGNYRIENNIFRGFKMVAKPGPDGLPVSPFAKLVKDDGKYMQGEPVNCDDRLAQVRLIGNKAYDNGDAGYDLKCNMVEMDGNYTEGANYGYRLWGIFSAGTNTSHNPRSAHLGLSKGARGSMAQLIATGDSGSAIIRIEGPGAVLDLKTCKFELGAPAKMFSGAPQHIAASKITLGPSCQPDKNGYAVNTDLVGACSFDKPLFDKNGDKVIDLGIINRAVCGERRVKLIGKSRSAKYVYEKAA